MALGLMETNSKHRAFREFVVSCGFVLFCAALVWLDRNDSTALEHVTVSGTLKEHEVFGRRKSPTLRFKLAESELDFRVDPSLYRYAMEKVLPPGFEPGAAISVLVMKSELAQPDSPILNGNLRIAWVHGLTVNGREIFGLSEMRTWEREDQYWGYALLAGSLAAAVYFGVKWRRSSGPTSRSTRPRARTRAPG